jgi:hypothetical protein
MDRRAEDKAIGLREEPVAIWSDDFWEDRQMTEALELG